MREARERSGGWQGPWWYWLPPLLVLVAGGAGVTPGVVRAADSRVVPVVAGFSDHASLTIGLRRRIREVVSRRLVTRPGDQVAWTPMPEDWEKWAGRDWSGRLTTRECRRLALDDEVQALVLWVGYRHGTYDLVCGVFHREFDDVVVSRTVHVVDRSVVVNHAGRLVQRLWSSVGEVVARRSASLVVSLDGRTNETVPKLGTPLEVVRIARTADGNRRQVWSGQFLVVNDNRDAAAVVTRIPGGGDSVPEFFRHIGDPRVRFFVRSMKPLGGSTRIRVVRESNGLPREACEVHITNEPPAGAVFDRPPDGMTDAAGMFEVPFRKPGFRFVTVVCGFRRTTVPVASGKGQFPVVIAVPRYTPRKQNEAVRDRIQRRVNEMNEWVKLVTESVNESASDRDESVLQDGIAALERDPGWQQIRRELEEFKRRTVGENKDPRDTLAQGGLDRLDESQRNWRATIDSFKESLRTLKSDRLIGDFIAARDAFRWRDAVTALEQLVAVSRDSRLVKGRLTRLKRALAEHSREHGRARELAREHVLADTASGVLENWNELEKALRDLIREDDAPVLWELTAGLKKLETLLDEESAAITRKVRTSGDDLDDDELKQLADRGKAVGDTLMKLAAVGKDVSRLIKEFFSLGTT